jgi:cation diffusion facilitator CzcD-associated flavoprotein CzcO
MQWWCRIMMHDTKRLRENTVAHMPVLAHFSSKADFSGERSQLLPSSLDDLECLVRRELDLTRYPAVDWVVPRLGPDGNPALDVLIAGGGQAGLAAAFALQQQRVGNILAVDENPEGAEGPWGTYARMETLRTHKDVGGIELNIPSLSFRSWYEAQHGPYSWNDLYKVPTRLWHAYLAWYRRVLRLPVRNETRLAGFRDGGAGLIEIDLVSNGQPVRMYARTLVLATGMEGNGRRHIPEFIRAALPPERFDHTHAAIDFAALAGKVVGVLGGGASAYDAAIIAAEHDASEVHIYHRDKDLNSINPGTWSEFSGYLAHFADLAPADRWRFIRQISRLKGGPPKPTLRRVAALPQIKVHAGVGWQSVAPAGGQVAIAADDGALVADHLILGTGYVLDPAARPEIAEHGHLIRTWRDVFEPPEADRNHVMLNAHFLGANFEILEKKAGSAPWLNRVFNFSRGAQTSMGVMPIGLSGIKFGLPRLVQGVTRTLFTEDAEVYFDAVKCWQASDLGHIDT